MEARNRPDDANRRTQNHFPCQSHALKCPGITRVFRLLGTNLGCPALYKDPPPRPGSCLLEGGRTPASEGERSGCMQDTPNPHLEVESREPVLVVKSSKLEANRAATMLALAPSSSDLGCGCVPSCALRRAFSMRHGGFQKINRPETDQNFDHGKKLTEPLRGGPERLC